MHHTPDGPAVQWQRALSDGERVEGPPPGLANVSVSIAPDPDPPALPYASKRLSTPFPEVRTRQHLQLDRLSDGGQHSYPASQGQKLPRGHRASLDVSAAMATEAAGHAGSKMSPGAVRRKLASRSLLEISASTENIHTASMSEAAGFARPRGLVKARHSLVPLESCVLYRDVSEEADSDGGEPGLDRRPRASSLRDLSLADERISAFDPLPPTLNLQPPRHSISLDAGTGESSIKTWAVLGPIKPSSPLNSNPNLAAMDGWPQRSPSPGHTARPSTSAVIPSSGLPEPDVALRRLSRPRTARPPSDPSHTPNGSVSDDSSPGPTPRVGLRRGMSRPGFHLASDPNTSASDGERSPQSAGPGLAPEEHASSLSPPRTTVSQSSRVSPVSGPLSSPSSAAPAAPGSDGHPGSGPRPRRPSSALRRASSDCGKRPGSAAGMGLPLRSPSSRPVSGMMDVGAVGTVPGTPAQSPQQVVIGIVTSPEPTSTALPTSHGHTSTALPTSHGHDDDLDL